MMTLTYNDMAVEVFRGGERSEEEQFAQRVYCRMLIRHMQRQSQTTPGFSAADWTNTSDGILVRRVF
jgi:hypothetical protein